MTNVRATKARATAALLLVAVTACSNGDNAPAQTGSPAASTSLTPTPQAPTTAPTTPTTPPSETELAAEAASTLLRQYFATVDQLRQQPKRPISGLGAVAISTQLAAQKKLIQDQRSNGLHQTGSTTIAKIAVQSVNLDDADPTAGEVPTIQIDVCYDVSGVDILDSRGRSVVSPDRPDNGWVRYSVANYEWDTNPRAGWRVASGTDLKRAPCAAS